MSVIHIGGWNKLRDGVYAVENELSGSAELESIRNELVRLLEGILRYWRRRRMVVGEKSEKLSGAAVVEVSGRWASLTVPIDNIDWFLS